MTEAKIRPVVLAIGGSDSAGMAGIQMDQRVISALGVHAATAITAVTAQNNQKVMGVNPVAADVLLQQLEACRALTPAVIKIGLLANSDQVRLVCDFLRDTELPAVLDPVLASSSGTAFADSDTHAAIRTELMPLCLVVTPNIPETEQLTGMAVNTPEDAEEAAALLCRLGANTLVIKGGHLDSPISPDFYLGSDRSFWLCNHRLPAQHSRGTGCAFAAGLAAALALGYSGEDAVVVARMAINQGLRQGYGYRAEPGPVHVDHFPDNPRDLPVLIPASIPASGFIASAGPFPDCGDRPLGLYPIVDRAHWLERLLPAGVTTIQLRIKDLEGEALRLEVESAVALSRRYNARLFINDHWQLAIEAGAFGVHLGHEDLDSADTEAIRRAGLRLGISTHCHHEVARAHSYRPSYMACGPIYPTTTKDMPWVPHRTAGLRYWRRVLAEYPLVAIGGIDGERLPKVAATGVDGIAMINALTGADYPEWQAREFISILGRYHDR